MKLPLQFTCRNVVHSDELEQEVGKRVAELETFSGDIIGCHVMLERPHLHPENGNQCHVRIELTIPGETIVVSHQPSLHGALRDVDEVEHSKETTTDAQHRRARLAIHEAFDRARRRLQDAVRRQRGDVKSHDARMMQAAAAGRAEEG
jgi:ribosome-associated translation inhibitor RaiA